MKILIDLCHPADVHFFKLFYNIMIEKKHNVIVTARNKEVTYKLLDAYNINYIPYGKHYKSLFGKLFGILKIDFQLLKISKRLKPDLFFCMGSFYASHVAFLLRKPFITLEDTGNMEQILLYKYFSNTILTPDTFTKNLGKNQIWFKGTKELAYLYKGIFKPNPEIYNDLGLKFGEKFVLLRFVGWNATHDIGNRGISIKNKLALISELSKYFKIIISSESELPSEIAKYKANISPEKILDVMYYAELLYGESATMASECALLGTPAIFVNNAQISYTIEQEKKYGLVYNYSESELDQEKSILKAIELLKDPNLKPNWKIKNEIMMNEQINLTNFMVWFIENYPESVKVMKENPDYQYRFR